MPPRLHRMTAAILCAGLILSSLFYGIASIVLGTRLSPTILGFEPVAMIACIFGLLYAAGRFAWAPAMTLLTVAGTVAVATAIVFFMQKEIEIKGQASGWSLKPYLFARLAACGVLLALAVHHVISRDKAAVRSFWRGALAFIPVIASSAGVVATWKASSFGASGTSAPGLAAWASAGLLLLLGVVACVTACIAGQYLITAFEIGADVAEGRTSPKGSQASSAAVNGATPPMDARSS